MKIDVTNFCNFSGLKSVEIGQTYQYKEGSIIFNFTLASFINDGQYLYILGDITEKVQKHYGLNKLELTFSVEPFYYSGMARIYPKDAYWTDVDENYIKK